MNMDLTHNTNWQMVDRFARSLGVRDPVLDTYFSMQDKYVGEGRSMYASWPQSTYFWDKSATTVAAPESTIWGTVLTMEDYAELAEMARERDIVIKNVKLRPQDKDWGIGALAGIVPYL